MGCRSNLSDLKPDTLDMEVDMLAKITAMLNQHSDTELGHLTEDYEQTINQHTSHGWKNQIDSPFVGPCIYCS